MFIINKNIFITLIILLLSLTSSGSWAEPKNKYELAYSDCISESGTINNSIVYMCSENTTLLIKKDMNRLYNIVYKKLFEQSEGDAKKFEASQKSWLKYRNRHCELMGSYVGSPMYSYCPMKLNESRVSELADLAGEQL